MGLIGVVAGLILLLAGSGWFAGAATVGLILLIVGVVLIIAQAVAQAYVLKKVRDTHRSFFD